MCQWPEYCNKSDIWVGGCPFTCANMNLPKEIEGFNIKMKQCKCILQLKKCVRRIE